MKKSYFVRYLTAGDQDRLVILPNWWKLLRWFLRESRKCAIIHIWIEPDE
jgi:hypothetical protein